MVMKTAISKLSRVLEKTSTKSTPTRNALKATYGDQKRQVEFLINNVFDYETCGLPRNGFFVDLACADGITINNTIFLEKYLGWTGLLFEANPEYFDIIKKNRTSKLIPKCVSDKPDETISFVRNGMGSGIVSENTDNNFVMRAKNLKDSNLINLQTTTLEKEFIEHNVPKVIDFLSLDIEGAEWQALKSFPFQDYVFRAMVIERPTPELDLLLDSHKYRQVAHLDYDVFYVHEDYLNEVNLNPKLKFAFTARKSW